MSLLAVMSVFAVALTPDLLPSHAGGEAPELHVPVSIAVIDGKKVITTQGDFGNSEDTLNKLGVKLDKKDFIKSDMTLPNLSSNEVRRVITIDRAPEVTISVDGKKRLVKTREDKVADVLAGEKIDLNSQDIVSPTIGTNIRDGQKIRVVRIREVKKTVIIVIPHRVINRSDYNRYQGQVRTIKRGVDGLIKNQYRSMYKGGKLIHKILVKSSVLRGSVDSVVIRGVKPYDHEDLWNIMVKAGAEWGVDPSEILRVGMCESHLNPASVGFAVGLMQYKPSTWANAIKNYPGGKFARASIFDPTAQIYVTAWKVSTNGWSEWACKP